MVHMTNTDNPIDFLKVWKDALGIPIAIGQRYGYSTSDGGWARTTVGTAIKITKTGRVTLSVESIKKFLYGEPHEDYADADTVSIRAHMVFPVNEPS
jgi:hypothetical protein